jgi:hypothetical protein
MNGTRLRSALLSLSPDEATFEKRGFAVGSATARARLEGVGSTFLAGYHAAVEEGTLTALAARLGRVNLELRGFAFEGASMGLTLLDHLLPWRKRFRPFLEGPAREHVYMAHVGAGVAFGRLPWVRRRLDRALARFDPLLRWLAVDGYGFHEGFFHWSRCADGRPHPRGVSGYARHAFDQGLGRSIWFVDGADVDRIAGTIARFPEGRRGDLWAGIGLACAYAGGGSREDIVKLRDAGRPYRAALGQGAAFAAKARQRAGNPAAHTETATEILCGTSAAAAASLTDTALEGLGGDEERPAYERWRSRIQARLAGEPVEVSR